MWNDKQASRRGGHLPVNPMTGAPNTRTGNVADVAASLDATPTGSSAPSPKGGTRADGCGFGTPTASAPLASGTRDSASSLAGDRTFTTSNDSMDELLAKMRNILDSRLLSIVVLVLISFSVVAGENFPAFLIVVVVGTCSSTGLSRPAAQLRSAALRGSSSCSWAVFSRWAPAGFSLTSTTCSCSAAFCSRSRCAVSFLPVARCITWGTTAARLWQIVRSPRIWSTVSLSTPRTWRILMVRFSRWRALSTACATANVRWRNALRDEARRKDDLVTYLAHDLKTPLASVVGYLSLLEEAPDLPVEQRARFTGIALDKAHRLDALIEEFFDITRFDFHDIVLTRGYVDLALLLAQVADEFYPILTEQGKSVEVEATASLIVLIDGDKMARVFNNVMKNAIAYSYEGSTIRIFAEQTSDSVVVRFENQGDPIPAPKLGMIFEKFYRLDAARATNRGGAGLGWRSPRRSFPRTGAPFPALPRPRRRFSPSSCLTSRVVSVG